MPLERPKRRKQWRGEAKRTYPTAGEVRITHRDGSATTAPAVAFHPPDRKSVGRHKWPNVLAYQLKINGFANYQDYLASAHWRDLRKRYFASQLSKRCHVCGRPGVDLHHKTYRNLGHEYLWDLVPLCREHHREVHRFVREHGNDGVALWSAARKLRNGST